jgi:hypothetical protein
VQDIGYGDSHRFDVGVGDQFLIGAIDAGDVKLLGQLAAALFFESRDRDNFRARDFCEPL